ncbi:MAG TPA: hypothetical protein VGG19_06030 [Tepidisphaeraceae bacterium]|jgi:hypothetical protein
MKNDAAYNRDYQRRRRRSRNLFRWLMRITTHRAAPIAGDVNSTDGSIHFYQGRALSPRPNQTLLQENPSRIEAPEAYYVH